jgi:hypothetical protein
MKKAILILFTLVVVTGLANGQGKYLTSHGSIVFYSHTAIEDITAENTEVGSVIDAEKGEVAVIVEMMAFQFEKKLMQEHFNENYVESEKFPKARFNGKMLNNNEVDYSSDGEYMVRVEGELTIHGVTNRISAEGTIEIKHGTLTARTKFMLNPEDYGIRVPSVVRKNIAEEMEIRVNLELQPI